MKRVKKRTNGDLPEKKQGEINKTVKGKKRRELFKTEQVSLKMKLLWSFILIVVTVTAYYPAFDNEITSWDDEFYLNDNPFLKDLSGENISTLFKTDTYYMGNYHPLSMISLSLDYAIGGEDENGNINPFMFHFTNIFLHIITSLLVFWLIFLLIKNFNIAVIVGLLFGVHTIHVESVAWISERKDVLYAVFFVASLIAYIKYIDQKKVSLYILALFLFLLSLFSKGQAVSLAITIFIIDYIRERKILNIKVLGEKILFLIPAVIFGLIAIGAQQESEALVDEQAYSFTQRIALASYAFMQYIFKLIIPVNLSAIYPYPDIIRSTVPGLYYLMILPVLFIGGLFVWLIKKGKRIFVFGIGFFIINIFLLLQFIPVGSAVLADRYAYIPSVGIFIIVAVMLVQFIKKNEKTKQMIFTAIGIYIGVLTFLSIHRCDIWQDSEALWTDTVEKSPNSVIAWNNLGSFKDKEAAKAMEEMRFEEAKELRLNAIGDFSKAIKGKPDYKNAFYNRGVSSFEVGKLMRDSAFIASSIEDFNKALEQDGQFSDAYHQRGNAKAELGQLGAALKDYDLAIAIKPDDFNFYTNRGVTKGKMGNIQGAIDDFNQALVINPNESAIYSNRGRAKMLINDIVGAIADYDIAIQLNPRHYTAFFNRALAKNTLKDSAGAIEDLSKAININPGMQDAYYWRAIIYLDQNKRELACSDLKKSFQMGISAAGILIQQYCQ